MGHLYSRDTSIQGTQKWSRKNVHGNFVSVTAIEQPTNTPLQDVFNEIDIDPVDGQVSTRELTEYLEKTSDEKDIDFGVLAASYVSAADTDGNGYLNPNGMNLLQLRSG